MKLEVATFIVLKSAILNLKESVLSDSSEGNSLH